MHTLIEAMGWDMTQHQITTVEPCIDEAKFLVQQVQSRLANTRHRHFLHIFTALADDDKSIGLLAYYIWRRRNRRQT